MRALVLSAQLVCLVIASSGFLACEGSEHEPGLVRALDRLVTSVDEEDWSTIWNMTDDGTRSELLQLHQELHEALSSVAEVVAPEDLKTSRRALGSALIAGLSPGAPAAGPRLLSRLFNISGVHVDEHARDGLHIESVVESDGNVTVTTIVGEEFAFQRTEDGWRSLWVLELMARSKLVATYRAQAVAVTERERAHRQSWSASQDPMTAHGAYNLARQALLQTPIDAKALFGFLDASARDALVRAIERSRVVQRSVQKRHKGEARIAMYKKKKMWHYVRAGSDRQLYMYWAELPDFEAPFETRAVPVRVETAADPDQATVHTSDGGQVPLVRGADGFWKLAGQEKRLLKLLWEPMDRAYERMARPPEFWKYKDD